MATTRGRLSCYFDLDPGTVAPGQEENLEVRLGDTVLVYGDPDGFQLHDGTSLEITGAACAQYRDPSAPSLTIDFECSVLE